MSLAVTTPKKDAPDLKMQFTLTGFSQVQEYRVFTFEGVAADRSRSAFTVRTDLALTRQYAIRIQELPLLCRAVLERHEGDQLHALTFTEDDMRVYANMATARDEAAKRRKPARSPSTDLAGAAWRTTPRPAENGIDILDKQEKQDDELL